MSTEIERKFLTQAKVDWDSLACGQRLVQGYLSTDKHATVRVRIRGEQAWLTIKGKTQGFTRSEFEYAIPLSDAEMLLSELCQQPVIDKIRYEIPCGDHVWEVDVFSGDNAGLVVAEIELSSEDEAFQRPEWLTEEVSDDPRYFNANLIKHPYQSWQD
jgi:adenylate cyclase